MRQGNACCLNDAAFQWIVLTAGFNGFLRFHGAPWLNGIWHIEATPRTVWRAIGIHTTNWIWNIWEAAERSQGLNEPIQTSMIRKSLLSGLCVNHNGRRFA